MSELSDRIKKATEDFYIYDPCWHPDDWANAIANAVIGELGLTQEFRDGYSAENGLRHIIRHRKPQHRYVTDWETDDE